MNNERELRGIFAGSLAAAVALAVGELMGGLLSQGSGLVVAVGGLVIDLVPPALKDFGIGVFGTADKPALVIGIIALSMVFGALLGRRALGRFWIAIVGFAAFGAIGAWAVVNDPMLSTSYAWLGPFAAVAAGLATLTAVLHVGAQGARPESAGRRAFIQAFGLAAAFGAVSLATGRYLLNRARRVAASSRDEVLLPTPRETVADPGAAASFQVPNLEPIIVPNDDFYRIDTALVVPRVDLESWRLRITGMVDRPYSLSLDDLLAMPMVERYVTLSCVSNRVGGRLVGNAKWLGVPLQTILERAGVQAGATQIVGRSVDDFTVGFPTEVAFDGREALVAVGMNGEPLPFDHGFPARLVVSGLYGYVSATKWLSEIELTTLDGFDAYWIPRGWAKEAPIKTQSRIDVPFRGRLDAGTQAVAGVAWAPNRGIARVEVSIDGEWVDAELSEPLAKDSWVQWLYEWDATPGDHVLEVRATDGTGETQTSVPAAPRPDGAAGWHTVSVSVS